MPRVWTDIRLAPEAGSMLARETELFGPGVAGGGEDPLTGIEEADGALSSARVSWGKTLFQRAKALKVVARSGIGFDNIDIDAATACGICATNTPESPTEATAEFTIALILALARKVCLADRRFRTEGWIPPVELAGIDLAGRTLGLVGLGRIGSRVGEIALALRMKVIACDPFASAEAARARGVELKGDLRTLLSSSDVVSLHVPLSAQNRGLIGRPELAAMKRGSMLINAARGAIVVQDDLVAALQSGHLAGAALDVWDPEPSARDNPLLRFDNVVATPHIAGQTAEALRLGNLGAAESVLMVLRGERPGNLINPGVWESRR